jgi:hypothetical protein
MHNGGYKVENAVKTKFGEQVFSEVRCSKQPIKRSSGVPRAAWHNPLGV